MCRDGLISLFHFFFPFFSLVLSFGEYVGWGRLGIFTNGFAGYGIWRSRQLIGRVGFWRLRFCFIFDSYSRISLFSFFTFKLLLTVFFASHLHPLLEELFALICVSKTLTRSIKFFVLTLSNDGRAEIGRFNLGVFFIYISFLFICLSFKLSFLYPS